MGNTNTNNQGLIKGEGFRVVTIKKESPFDGKVEPFFDFIISVKEQRGQDKRSASQILDKLGNDKLDAQKYHSAMDILKASEDKKLHVVIVSTKHRNYRTEEITPNSKWNGSKDLIGITVRKQRYDDAFDTYCPISQIAVNSPIQKASITQGQYLLGCLEFSYSTINQFVEGLFQIYFDKEVVSKNVTLAVYSLVEDRVFMKNVTLKRNWGGKGLLGCQFMQGMLHKFPDKFQQKRNGLIEKEKENKEHLKMRSELGQCLGASKSLAEALKNKGRRNRHIKKIEQLLIIEPFQREPYRPTNEVSQEQRKGANTQQKRITVLEDRVHQLQQTIYSVKQYLTNIDKSEHSSQ